MYKVHSPSDSQSDMLSTLSSEGIFLIEDFLSEAESKKLFLEVKELCNTRGGHYEFGRNYRGGNLNSHSTSIANTFSTPWMEELSKKYTGNNSYGDKVYATHDFISDKGLARNGWLHFDRSHSLKYFLYLIDVDRGNGAFSISPGTNVIGKQLREEAWKSKEYEGVKNRIEIDYPELLNDNKPIPVEAPKGTLIVFDSDTFHKGGIVDQGRERLVIRLHNYF